MKMSLINLSSSTWQPPCTVSPVFFTAIFVCVFNTRHILRPLMFGVLSPVKTVRFSELSYEKNLTSFLSVRTFSTCAMALFWVSGFAFKGVHNL